MVDVGGGADRSSNDLKAQAYTEPWSPKDYSSDPEYDGEAMSYAVDAFDSFPVQEKKLVADGGRELDPRVEQAAENVKVVDANPTFDRSGYGTRERKWGDHPSDYSEEAGEVLGQFFDQSVSEALEPDRDPRVKEAENSEFNIDMEKPVQ